MASPVGRAQCELLRASDVAAAEPSMIGLPGMCNRSGSQVDQHQSLAYAMAKQLKRLTLKHTVKEGSPFTADRDFRRDAVVQAGGELNTGRVHWRLPPQWYPCRRHIRGPRTTAQLQRGSATIDGSAVATSEARKRGHYACLAHVSFDKRIFKLATLLAVKSFGRLGRGGMELLEQVATGGGRGRTNA